MLILAIIRYNRFYIHASIVLVSPCFSCSILFNDLSGKLRLYYL